MLFFGQPYRRNNSLSSSFIYLFYFHYLQNLKTTKYQTTKYTSENHPNEHQKSWNIVNDSRERRKGKNGVKYIKGKIEE